MGGLVLASDVNLYGTTSSGGAGTVGTVFKISPDGTESAISDFAGTAVGLPSTDLLIDPRSNLYGTSIGENYGSVFELTPKGRTLVLHSFSSRTDGSFPDGGLIANASGYLYGTTFSGGADGYRRHENASSFLDPAGAGFRPQAMHAFLMKKSGGRSRTAARIAMCHQPLLQMAGRNRRGVAQLGRGEHSMRTRTSEQSPIGEQANEHAHPL